MKSARKRIYPALSKLDPEDREKRKFAVTWSGLNYFANRSRQILHNVSGCFKSGELMALMGPSGAGKSTMLDCICGRRKSGMTGDVRISGVRSIKIGFVPQFDYLIPNLTVFETFFYAARFRGLDDDLVKEVILQFGLGFCAENFAGRCSGGQQRRLSIALEYLMKPDILILDEPTTGLDTQATQYFIAVMLELVQTNAIAVVATIHQPNAFVFKSFHRVYVLSRNGRCIYQGPPGGVVVETEKIGLRCPPFTNPADFIIEVAAADYGDQWLHLLATNVVNNVRVQAEVVELASDSSPLASMSLSKVGGWWRQMAILVGRSGLVLSRDSVLLYFRLLHGVLTGLAIGWVSGREVSKATGCLPPLEQIYSSDLNSLAKRVFTEFDQIVQNAACLFMVLMAIVFGALAPVLLIFPTEMNCVRKECRNNWYSLAAYYLSVMIVQLPLHLVVPFCLTSSVYVLSGQVASWDRFLKILVVAILTSLASEGVGQVVGAAFMNDVNSAVFVGLLMFIPLTLFAGFLVTINSMPVYFRAVSWLNYFRFAYEAFVLAIYGFGRCREEESVFFDSLNRTALRKPRWVKVALQIEKMRRAQFDQDDLDDEDYFEKEAPKELGEFERLLSLVGFEKMDQSYFIKFLQLSDDDYFRAIYFIVAYILILKIVAFFVIRAKVYRNR